MTGYDPSSTGAADQRPPGQADATGAAADDFGSTGSTLRIEPTWVTQPPVPQPGPPAVPAQPGAPESAPYRPSSGYPIPFTPPSSAGPTGPAPAGYPGPTNQPAARPPHPPMAPRRRLAWPGILALLLVSALAGVVAFQARQIDRLNAELGRVNARLGEAQSGDDTRLDSLEGRAGALEKQAGEVFNPEAIAAAVLPSVFRVSAGEFSGTAFAVGRPAGGGGTNLFTNFHVVESVWDSGGRQVSIERRGKSQSAQIVKVDKANDVAQLRTEESITGLVTAPAAVKAGQQIVVVGAPLGLEDSVTTGVVSAFRKLEDGSGTVIQFSAPINPGNSGGPVINREKQVVGIATAKARDAEGIGLAVPIRTACDQFAIC